MADPAREEHVWHGWLHLVLVAVVLYTLYPVLWVVTIAFSGKQSLAIADLPAQPDRPGPAAGGHALADPVVARQLRLGHERPALRPLDAQQRGGGGGHHAWSGVALSCTAAYAFSRFKFPGRRAGMMAFLVSQMFPGVLTLIPLYIIIVQWLGLGSTRLGLIIVYATTSIPFSVWMLKGYFDTIPKELEEAAIIEGAGPGTIFWTDRAAAGAAGHRHHRALLLHDRLERVHPGRHLHGPGAHVHRAGGPAGSSWAASSSSGATSRPARSSSPSRWSALFLYLQKYLVGGLTAGSVKG